MKLLILCTGNTCRSPMAEGIVKKLLKEHSLEEEISVRSMGFAAFDGSEPTSHAVKAMEEIGIDISEKRSRRVMLQDLAETDRFYVMTPSHKNILLDAMPDLEERIFVLDIPDPYGSGLDTYRECRDQMMQYFEKEAEGWAGEDRE